MESIASPPAPSSRRRSLFKRIFFSAVVFFSCLLLAEVAVRARSWWRHGSAATSEKNLVEFDARYDLRVPIPNATRVGSREAIRINSLGFRGKEFAKKKDPGTIRIFCVGASTTFGTGSSTDETTWPAYLEKELLATIPSGFQIEVINAGIPGCRIQHTIQDIERRLLQFRPDVILFYHANNDIAEDTRNVALVRGLIGSDNWMSQCLRWGAQYSLLLDLAQKNLKILRQGEGSATGRLNGLPKDLAEEFSASLNRLVDLAEKHRLRLLFATFPVKYRRDQTPEVQAKNADVAFYYMPWMSMNDLLDAMDMYNQAILEVGNARKVPVVELRHAVPADAGHFVDCMHMTDQGCQIVARQFAEALLQSGMLSTRGEDPKSSAPDVN